MINLSLSWFSSQTFPIDSWCDLRTDCQNEADETDCMERYLKRFRLLLNPFLPEAIPPPPAIVNFWGNGTHTVTSLVSENGTVRDCPASHFQCPGHDYCLPVYLRCNGVRDCGDWQDEADCDTYTCPGFYRCRGSRVCLHADHVCDNVTQCPQRDDELLCDLVCPEHCTCHGLAFTCTQVFTPRSYPTLRYLKAAGTGLSPTLLSRNTHLVYLNLAACHVTNIEELIFPHLHVLDLTNNDLSVIDGFHLLSLPRLKVLFLGGNPLMSNIFSAVPLSGSTSQLIHLDLSNVSILELQLSHLRLFPMLQSLNLSGSGMDVVTMESFPGVPQLRQLDFRGCPLSRFTQHAFRELRGLQKVWADSYKVCCPQQLPPDFNLNQCLAPGDPVSSCDSLLGHKVLQVLFPLLAILSLLGNACAIFSHVFVLKVCRRFGFGVFLTHLSLSDFVMGVYLAVIGVADSVYKDKYVLEDTAWRQGVVCGMSGALWFLASEVSALIVCLITLDRVLVLLFPLSRLHFRVPSAHLACGIVWLTCLLLSFVPQVSHTAISDVYRSSGLCVPLLASSSAADIDVNVLHVINILNFLLFLIVVAGQIRVYVFRQSNSLSFFKSMSTWNDINIARRLSDITWIKVLCWFPVHLLAFLAYSGVAVAGPALVKEGLHFMLVPLSSALNPYLYAVNLVLEKQRELQLERLVTRLRARDLERGNKDRV